VLTPLAAPVAADFHPPGPGEFEYPAIFGPGTFVTKPMLIVVVGSILIGAFFYLAARRAAVVPGKQQFLGESFYLYVRDGMARDTIGPRRHPYVPYLVTLFAFILVLNIAGIIPFVQFPATSRIALPLFLALISCILFNWVGIRREGFVGYFKHMMFPSGVPWPIYFLLAPIEFISTVIIRPITLTLRLALNMFAGHLVLLLCILGGEFLLLDKGGLFAALSIVPFVGSIVLTFFEGFVQLLQAYVFTLLTALYIAGALEAEH
jgi:F-type H+-transporting ATPase subunit a